MSLKPFEKTEPKSFDTGLNKMLVPGSRLRIYSPTFKGSTVFRPVPQLLVADDGSVTEVPWRNNEGKFGMSWFVQDYTVDFWGIDSQFSALLDCSDQEQNWPTGSPFQLFYQDMSRNADFKWLLDPPEGSKSYTGPVSKARLCGFLKGVLITHNGERMEKPMWGVVLKLASSAKDAFEELINTPSGQPGAATEDDPFGWDAAYEHGSPIALETGKVFEFKRLVDIEAEAAGGVDLSGPATGAGDGGKNSDPTRKNKYGCRIWPATASIPAPKENVLDYNESFEDAFNYMTGEDQVLTIMGAFGTSAKDAVIYTFGDTGILPDSFVKGSRKVDMGANSAAKQDEAPVDLGGDPAVKPEDAPVDLGAGAGKPAADAPVDLGAPASAAEAPKEEDTLPFDGGKQEEAPAAPAAEGENSADSIRARLAKIKG